MTAPLFVKYRTQSHRHYFYDFGTGRIVEVDEVIFAILDEYGVMTREEILDAYEHLGRENVETAFREIEGLRNDGYLADHRADELCSVERIVCENNIRNIEEFWQNTGELLVLGITERCNLDCAYCCYSGKFKEHRTHNDRSMSFEVARKAITDFLDQDNTNLAGWPISFYGGEPLLEWELLKNCVEHAENYARSLGKTTSFAITTNGTLLDEAVCDYLVEHNFLVMISLDGPRSTHDRYRVFPNGKGSFQTIYANINRFAEKYPDYLKRGLNFTLAPPLEVSETEKIVEESFPKFPLSRIALVNPGREYRLSENTASSTQYGCYSTTACHPTETPAESFRNFRPEDRLLLMSLWLECVENLKTYGSAEARKRRPFSTYLFEPQLQTYHRRPIRRKSLEGLVFMPCMPGFTRRFCDVEGNYRVCERVDDSLAYRLGDVWTGLDANKMRRTLELRRHFGDCANCVSLNTCDICYARIPCSDMVSGGFDPGFERMCHQNRESARTLLTAYTEIMEVNPKAFDRPQTDRKPTFKEMLYVPQNPRRSKAVLEQLKTEKYY